MSAELRALVALVVIALLGWVGYQALFTDSVAVAVVLQEVHGDVQVDAGGHRTAAAVGGQIGASDRLVSGADGRAVLTFGTESQVTLEPNTSVQVTSVDATGVKLSLEDGRVRATVRPGGPKLGVSAAGRSITATDADFDVARAGDEVGVQASRGSVSVDDAVLRAGERAVLPKTGTPLQLPASDELLLQVSWPAVKRTAGASVRVTGSTEPGAHVQARSGAGTAEARAAADGSFALDMPIGEGENTVELTVVNVFGQVAKAEWQVDRDSKPPAIGVHIE